MSILSASYSDLSRRQREFLRRNTARRPDRLKTNEPDLINIGILRTHLPTQQGGQLVQATPARSGQGRAEAEELLLYEVKSAHAVLRASEDECTFG
jgi:hypothetical protein